MDRLEATRACLAALQLRRAAATSAGPTTGTRAAALQARRLPPTVLQQAAAQCIDRLRGLDGPPAHRREFAVRCFLEAVLLRTWGERLARDPGFAALVDAVVAGLQADAELAQAADALATQLCEAARDRGGGR